MTCRILLSLLAALLLGCLSAQAKAADPMDEDAQALAQRLAGPDAGEVAKAVEEIQTQLESDPDHSIGYLRRYWLKPLLESQRHDLVENLCLRGILAAAHRTGDVEFLQETRVRSYVAADKPKEALVQAKALFNVCGMRNTEKALLLVAECLKAAHPQEETQVLRQLAKEQRSGAATRPAAEAPATGGLLNEIAIDSGAYQTAIQNLSSDDDRSPLAKGNLLLLSGQAKEARTVFEQLLKLAGPSLALHENIARALRAEDGNIGRANGYLLALPEDQR